MFSPVEAPRDCPEPRFKAPEIIIESSHAKSPNQSGQSVVKSTNSSLSKSHLLSTASQSASSSSSSSSTESKHSTEPQTVKPGRLVPRKSMRNTKNLSLNLSGISNNDSSTEARTSVDSILSPLSSLPFRRQMLKDSSKKNNDLRQRITSPDDGKHTVTRRRTMLSLSIPDGPTGPTTPINLQNSRGPITSSSADSSAYGSPDGTKILYTRDDVTHTILKDFSKLTMGDNFDENKLDAYPNGPANIFNNQLFLYSAPNLDEIRDFAVVINVAKEVLHPFPNPSRNDFNDKEMFIPLPNTNDHIFKYSDKLKDSLNLSTDYYYVPWTHTSKLCLDFPILTDIIDKTVKDGKKVLIHCQCGVSRSASLIIAYIMKMKHQTLTEAYQYVKERACDISPNMTLIFQLMEWGDIIGCGVAKSPGFYEGEQNKQNVENDGDKEKEKLQQVQSPSDRL